MKKLKIYLDTSVYSALYDERNLNRQKQTEYFWNYVKNYELFFSDINLDEINGITNQELKNKLKYLLKNGTKIKFTPEVKGLTEIYIKEGDYSKKI